MRRDEALGVKRVVVAVVGLVCAVGVVLLGGCEKAERADLPTEENPGEIGATIRIDGMTWDPAEVTISSGQSIVWDMKAPIDHDLEVGDFLSPLVSEGEYQMTFDDSGDFDFRCTLHPGMDGVVHVSQK